MELDFSFIQGNAPEKPPSRKPVESSLDPAEYKTLSEAENAVEGQRNALESNQPEPPRIGTLERAAREEKQRKEAAAEVYRTYQQNIKLSGQLQTEILKGLKAGQDTTDLFLKACKAIALMVNNPLFYEQAEKDLKAIYGEGLLQPYPLQKELAETRERLRRLREAQQRETTPEDSKQRINPAIRAHEARAGELEALIAKANEHAGGAG